MAAERRCASEAPEPPEFAELFRAQADQYANYRWSHERRENHSGHGLAWHCDSLVNHDAGDCAGIDDLLVQQCAGANPWPAPAPRWRLLAWFRIRRFRVTHAR
jgi:hypothetical protein